MWNCLISYGKGHLHLTISEFFGDISVTEVVFRGMWKCCSTGSFLLYPGEYRILLLHPLDTARILSDSWAQWSWRSFPTKTIPRFHEMQTFLAALISLFVLVCLLILHILHLVLLLLHLVLHTQLHTFWLELLSHSACWLVLCAHGIKTLRTFSPLASFFLSVCFHRVIEL